MELSDKDLTDIRELIQGGKTASPARRGELMWKFDIVIDYLETLENPKNNKKRWFANHCTNTINKEEATEKAFELNRLSEELYNQAANIHSQMSNLFVKMIMNSALLEFKAVAKKGK